MRTRENSLAVDTGVRVDVADSLGRDREFQIVAPWAGRTSVGSNEFSDYVTFAWVVIGPSRINVTLLLYICHVSHCLKSGEQKSPQLHLNLGTS